MLIASVAIERFESPARTSKSPLQLDTLAGFRRDSSCSRRTAAKRFAAREEPSWICSMFTAGERSASVRSGKRRNARAASKATIYGEGENRGDVVGVAKTFDKEVKKRGAKLRGGIFAKQQKRGTKKRADRQRRRRQALLQLRHQLPLIVETWNHLGESESVVAFHGEKEEKTVVLDHFVGVIQ